MAVKRRRLKRWKGEKRAKNNDLIRKNALFCNQNGRFHHLLHWFLKRECVWERLWDEGKRKICSEWGERKAFREEKQQKSKKNFSSSRVPREASAASTASSSTAAAVASSAVAALPSHSERRSEGAGLGGADVLVAPRRAVVVEVALA